MMHNKILLVDDDVDDVLIFKAAIKELAPVVECATAKNGIDALTHLNTTETIPSVIFLDLNMPLMNGLECLERIKKEPRLKDIPVIIFTTSNHPHDHRRSNELGARMFMTKSADFRLLKVQLNSILNEGFLNTGYGSMPL